MVFGTAAAGCLLFAGRSSMLGAQIALLLAAAAGIQMRLLCNLFDGMVAIEGGFKTKTGEVFNELPDRWSDVVLFLAAGYSMPSVACLPELGWTSALLSVLTAYVRAFGGAAGASQYFCGPMAKQQRMAVMTVTCVVAAVLAAAQSRFSILSWSLGLICAGCVVTIVRRISLIVGELASK
jgi:phosphatidylglycerophosphate synthase